MCTFGVNVQPNKVNITRGWEFYANWRYARLRQSSVSTVTWCHKWAPSPRYRTRTIHRRKAVYRQHTLTASQWWQGGNEQTVKRWFFRTKELEIVNNRGGSPKRNGANVAVTKEANSATAVEGAGKSCLCDDSWCILTIIRLYGLAGQHTQKKCNIFYFASDYSCLWLWGDLTRLLPCSSQA